MSIFPQKEHYSFNSNSEPLVAIKTFDMTRLAGFVKTILFCHYVEQKYSSHFMQKWIKKSYTILGPQEGFEAISWPHLGILNNFPHFFLNE